MVLLGPFPDLVALSVLPVKVVIVLTYSDMFLHTLIARMVFVVLVVLEIIALIHFFLLIVINLYNFIINLSIKIMMDQELALTMVKQIK